MTLDQSICLDDSVVKFLAILGADPLVYLLLGAFKALCIRRWRILLEYFPILAASVNFWCVGL